MAIRHVIEKDLEWWVNDDGQFHREDGPAWINTTNNAFGWYVDGRRHRAGGPAKRANNGDLEWWMNGQLHREDGPAIEYANGLIAWWLFGARYYSEDAWFEAKKKLIQTNEIAKDVKTECDKEYSGIEL